MCGGPKETKDQIFVHLKTLAPTRNYLVQVVADNLTTGATEIKIILLPVVYPELNPIEMVWGTVNQAVAATNMNFSRLSEVEKDTRGEIGK